MVLNGSLLLVTLGLGFREVTDVVAIKLDRTLHRWHYDCYKVITPLLRGRFGHYHGRGHK